MYCKRSHFNLALGRLEGRGPWAVAPTLPCLYVFFLLGQEINRRMSTGSEWTVSVDLVIFFLTFLAEFTRISFDAPALKVAEIANDAIAMTTMSV